MEGIYPSGHGHGHGHKQGQGNNTLATHHPNADRGARQGPQGNWEVATMGRPGDNGGRGQWLSEPPLCQELDSSGVGIAAA